jgi:hypothetical protein
MYNRGYPRPGYLRKYKSYGQFISEIEIFGTGDAARDAHHAFRIYMLLSGFERDMENLKAGFLILHDATSYKVFDTTGKPKGETVLSLSDKLRVAEDEEEPEVEPEVDRGAGNVGIDGLDYYA